MIWYKIKYGYIEKVEVVRETEKCVCVKRNDEVEKCLKHSPVCDYYKTFEGAYERGIKYCNDEIDKVERKLEACKEFKRRFIEFNNR
jgi:hypothetical protein